MTQSTEKPEDLMCEESKKILKDENIVCVIKRSKNRNVVIYRAKLKDNKIDASNPLEVFWLKIEPSYIKKRRSQGYKDDRTELTYLESTMAYGVSCVAIKDKTGEYKVTFTALSKRPVTMKLDKNGIPRCYGECNGKQAILREMFVQTKENWIGLPTVQYVNLMGNNIEDGSPVEEKVTP